MAKPKPAAAPAPPPKPSTRERLAEIAQHARDVARSVDYAALEKGHVAALARAVEQLATLLAETAPASAERESTWLW